jgi:hypothetical protein
MAQNRQKIQRKHAEPSTADTAPEKIKLTYSTNINKTCG